MQRRFFREKEWKGEIGRRLGAKTNIYVNGCQWQKQGLHQPLCLPTYYITVRHREENYTLTRHAESFKTFIFALCPGEHEDSLKHGSVHCSVPSVMPSQSRQPYSWRNPNAILRTLWRQLKCCWQSVILLQASGAWCARQCLHQCLHLAWMDECFKTLRSLSPERFEMQVDLRWLYIDDLTLL